MKMKTTGATVATPQGQTQEIYLVMELAVCAAAIFVDQFEGVGPVAIHVSIAIWNASVTQQKGHLVGGLWT